MFAVTQAVFKKYILKNKTLILCLISLLGAQGLACDATQANLVLISEINRVLKNKDHKLTEVYDHGPVIFDELLQRFEMYYTYLKIEERVKKQRIGFVAVDRISCDRNDGFELGTETKPVN